jgi:hypothetical protein
MKLLRNDSVTFSKILTEYDGQPVDLATQVTCRILSPSGRTISEGLAQMDLDKGCYNYRFIVPADAELTSIDHTWTIDWAFTLATGRVVNVVTEFDVVAENPDLPERSLILAEQSKEMVEFFLPEKAEAGTLEVFNSGNSKIYTLDSLSQLEVTPVESGFIYGLPCDTTNFPVDDYLFRLKAKLPNKRRIHDEIVEVRVVPNIFWHLYPSLMTLIDKVRKRSDMVQSYTKSDVYEYIRKGVSMLNLLPPQTTGWTLQEFPLGGPYHRGLDLSAYLISAAALWGLQAQVIMHGELNFSFNGQTVTLGYDASGALGSEIDLLLRQINEQFPDAKANVLRATQKVATVGVRRQFYDQGLSRLDTLRRALDIRMNYINQPISTMRYPF